MLKTQVTQINWDTRLNFGKCISWQYIDVNIWDYDTGNSDNVIISPQSYSVNPGHHNQELCDNQNCNMMVTFSMSLITDTCHCFSGGTCLPNDTCTCAVGYGGPRYEFPCGRLCIFARNAIDRDTGVARP